MLVRNGQKVWPEDERVWQTGEVGGASQGILRSRLGWRLEHRDPAMGEVSWISVTVALNAHPSLLVGRLSTRELTFAL